MHLKQTSECKEIIIIYNVSMTEHADIKHKAVCFFSARPKNCMPHLKIDGVESRFIFTSAQAAAAADIFYEAEARQ